MIRHNGIEIDRSRRTISHRGYVRQFHGSLQNRFFELHIALICAQPLSIGQLFDAIYPDPDGGPLAGPHIVHIRLQQQKKSFAKLGLEIMKYYGSGPVRYQLTPISLAESAVA